MKNLILAASVTMLAFTGVSAKNAIVTSPVKKITVEKKVKPLTKCYKWAVDDFGNKYLAQIPCPKTIIFKALEISPSGND